MYAMTMLMMQVLDCPPYPSPSLPSPISHRQHGGRGWYNLNKWVDGDGDGCLDGDGALEVGQIYWRYSSLGPHGFPPTPYGCALGHWGRNTFVIIVIMIMVVIIIIITIIVLILIMIKVLIMMIWSPPRQPRYPSLLFCPSSSSLCSASCPPMM